MNAGHADVKQPIHRVTHDFRSDARLFRHGEIRGARGCHQNGSRARLRVLLPMGDGVRRRMKERVRHHVANGLERLVSSARHQQRMTPVDYFGGNRRDLRRRLAQAKDHFGEALAKLPLVIHAREPEVLKRRRAHEPDHLFQGSFRRHPAVTYLVQQLLQIGNGHKSRRGC